VARIGLETRHIRFMVFDLIPSKVNDDKNMAFEERIDILKRCVCENEVVKMVEHRSCQGKDHLKMELDVITEKGGEGIMLRKASSKYVIGRTNLMLKVRKYQDCEVQFLHTSTTGISFVCLLPNGMKNKIKCAMSDFINPPPCGSVITVNHFGYEHNGSLKFPGFARVRHDMSWDKVIEQYQNTPI